MIASVADALATRLSATGPALATVPNFKDRNHAAGFKMLQD